MGKGRILKITGSVIGVAAAVTAAALTLQASNASTDRYNAVHMRNPVHATTPGWTCTNTGCTTQALKTSAQ